MDSFVRPAARLDVDELARLESEHRTALAAGVRGGDEWLRDHEAVGPNGWSHTLSDAASIVLVSGVDEVTLGLAAAHLDAAGQGGTLIAVVDLVYVTEGARELGLGEEMVRALVDWAGRSGATSIEAQALPGDRLTKNLFERVGLVARLITVSRSLP